MFVKRSVTLIIMLSSVHARADSMDLVCFDNSLGPNQALVSYSPTLLVPIKSDCNRVYKSSPILEHPNLKVTKKHGHVTVFDWNTRDLIDGAGGYYLIGAWTGADPAVANPWTQNLCGADNNMMGGQNPIGCKTDPIDLRSKGPPFTMLVRGTNPIYVSTEIGPLTEDLYPWNHYQEGKETIPAKFSAEDPERAKDDCFFSPPLYSELLDTEKSAYRIFYSENDKGKMATLSIPLDLGAGIFHSYRVNSAPGDGIVPPQYQGCANNYTPCNIPAAFDPRHNAFTECNNQNSPIFGTSGSFAEIRQPPSCSNMVAAFKTRVSSGSWGEVEGVGTRLRRQILDQSNLQATAFVQVTKTENGIRVLSSPNIELGFGIEPVTFKCDWLKPDPIKKYKLTEAIIFAPQGEEKIVRGWTWNSEILHQVGYPVQGAEAWRADTNTPPGTMVFGPYLQNLAPGTYTARFELSVSTADLNVTEDESLAYLDVWDARSSKTLASQEIFLKSFLKDDFRQQHRLTFFNPPNSSLEFRLSHKAKVRLDFHQVELLKHEPAGKWMAENSPLLGHQVGQAVTGGWRSNISTAAGAMVFGPYVETQKGVGMGEFSIRVLNRPSNPATRIATIDINMHDNGQNTVLASRDILSSDFNTTDVWHTFTLPYLMNIDDNLTKKVELRVYHYGKATVDVEYVTLWR